MEKKVRALQKHQISVKGFVVVVAADVSEMVDRCVFFACLPSQTPFKLPACLNSAALNSTALVSAALDLAAEVLVLTSASSHSNSACPLPAYVVVEVRP